MAAEFVVQAFSLPLQPERLHHNCGFMDEARPD
jgi:hypothetical protein